MSTIDKIARTLKLFCRIAFPNISLFKTGITNNDYIQRSLTLYKTKLEH